MTMRELCPYGEQSRTCGKCVTCHAIDPPAESKNRRVCQRTRQWPGCPRYVEAWRIGVIPIRADYIVKQEEIGGGIGGVGIAGIPMVAEEDRELPCKFVEYREKSCATCGGYVCTTAGDRRIMDVMVNVCLEEPWECAIFTSKEDGKSET